jgi:hypothetical protein
MGLTNQQIERYARQIIVPGIGGIAQDRLLSARLLLTGNAADIEPVLAYMVGAGVGEIRLQLDGDAAEPDLLVARAAQLNPEVVVKPNAEGVAGLNLLLAFGGDSKYLERLVRALQGIGVPLIFVRLDAPAAIAIIPGVPPCPLCSDANLLEPSKGRSDNAGFVAMIAAGAAFKLLSHAALVPTSTLLQFNGFACQARPLRQRSIETECPCSLEWQPH